MTVLDDLRFLHSMMHDNGYTDLRPLPGGRWTGIGQFIFTHAIIVGTMHNRFEYDDRWCYDTYDQAKAALDAWDGTGEPTGWKRHPNSGRRVKEDGSMYVNP